MDRRRAGHCDHVTSAAQSMRPPATVAAATAGPAAGTVATSALDFEALYEAHFDFVWRSMRRLGVGERALDDAVQDTFVVVHRRLGEFEGRSAPKTWIYGIARRVAHDYRRRNARKEGRAGELPAEIADAHAPDPREAAARSEAVRTLYALLDCLDDDKREVFVLAELEQMTVPEIATAIAANVNTVYSRLRAARRSFEQALARHRARGKRDVR